MENKKIIEILNKNIVVINSIVFKGKRKINWHDVELYLKQYIGKYFKIKETNDIILIQEYFW